MSQQDPAHSTITLHDLDATTLAELKEKPIAELPASAEAQKDGEVDESRYPTGVKLWLIMGALLLVEFLVGLDQTIVATATATVANEFSALQDVGWYGSAYLLTSCALMPLAGRAYAYFSQKYVFLAAVIIFELGSVISAVAQSSRVFILGRALQGSGYAGVFIGVLAISASSLPRRLLPVMTSLMGACYGAGAVLGPLIGGAITSSSAGWRWCFWINLPPGAVAGVIVFLWMNPPPLRQTLSVRQRIARMDWAGAACLLGALICLLTALQEGGIIMPWRSSKIIGLLVGFGLLMISFFALQVYLGDSGSISTRLLRIRSIAFTAAENFACGSTYYSILYWVPLFFQTVQGSSPVRSGIQSIAIVLPCMLFGTIAGALVSRFGSFYREMLFGAGATAIAAGLFSTMDRSTSAGKWIGFQILAGAGMGALYMLGFVATQFVLSEVDRARGAAVVTFTQLFGATIFVSACEAIYASSFAAGLRDIPGLVDVPKVLESGVTGFRSAVSEEQLPAVLTAVENSLFNVFVAIAAIGSFGFLCIFGIEWKVIDVKKKSEG